VKYKVSTEGVKRTMSVYLTVNEVAERLQVRPRTVRKWVCSGKLKVCQLIPGGVLRFREDQLPEGEFRDQAEHSPPNP
jgi:excisionase family DNA binding protein